VPTKTSDDNVSQQKPNHFYEIVLQKLYTPLHCAACSNAYDIIDLMLKKQLLKIDAKTKVA
jgi:hypothetical protein